jgi:hypothetical protein
MAIEPSADRVRVHVVSIRGVGCGRVGRAAPVVSVWDMPLAPRPADFVVTTMLALLGERPLAMRHVRLCTST